MATLPTALLSKLYEPDSLRNLEDGFELAFKNRLAPSTLVGVGQLTVDGLVFDSSRQVVRLERPSMGHGRPPEPLVRTGSEITSARAVPFSLNTVARVLVNGQKLPPGSYRLTWSFKTKEVGDITVTATDEVAED